MKEKIDNHNKGVIKEVKSFFEKLLYCEF